MDEFDKGIAETSLETEGISRFTESYASFSRIINSLQRKYLELRSEFAAQNERLAEANRQLVELGEHNLAANEFLNSILDAISVGVVAVDQNGRVTHFNPAASEILGIERDKPRGRLYRETLPPGEPVNANALRTAETGREVTATEKTLKRSDGCNLKVSVSTAILRDGEGQARGAVEVFQDLTRLKKMEQELARLNTLAALGEMAATVAHEVRNPLNGISGFAALLERDLEKDDPRRTTVRKIIRGVETLNDTVETLLSYSRSAEINRASVDYPDFLASVLAQFRNDCAERLKGIEIKLQTDSSQKDPPVRLDLDRVLFRQVLTNILDNAIEALNGDGRISISMRMLPRLEALQTHSERLLLDIGETVAETVIADTGCGIGDGHLDRVFSPFFTTRAGGTGLGLAVAWKIVKAHGGDIVAESPPDGGALFRILLPTRIDNTSRES